MGSSAAAASLPDLAHIAFLRLGFWGMTALIVAGIFLGLVAGLALSPGFGLMLAAALVTVGANLHPPVSTMCLLYSSAWPLDDLTTLSGAQTVEVIRQLDRRSAVRVELLPADMAILA